MIPIRTIHKAVCDFYTIPMEQPFVKTRVLKSLKPRRQIYDLSYRMNKGKMSYEEIGNYSAEEYGTFWDHSSVLNNVLKSGWFYEDEKQWRDEIDTLKEIVKSMVDRNYDQFKKELIKKVIRSSSYKDLSKELKQFILSQDSKEI